MDSNKNICYNCQLSLITMQLQGITMKSDVQQPQPMEAISLSSLKVDKFACLFFCLGIVLSAWFLHSFII